MTNFTNKFNDLIKDKDILKGIKDMEIEIPTEIQEKAIPIILNQENLIAESATGTGKTIAFLSGLLSNMVSKKKVQMLIIVPTRELALQVFKETKKVSKYKKVYSSVVYGGESIEDQKTELKKSDIVIGTPGRLIDQMNRGNFDVKSIKYLVLDEADRMCDMGFFEDISKIIDNIPEIKQTLLFSATITKDVSFLERKYLKHAKKVSVENKVDPKNLLQEYYVTKPRMKFSLLLHLIKENPKKSIIFCNTRREVDVIYNNLVKNGVEAFKLHGGLEQRKRTHTIDKYHKHKKGILISSDVSARGIHVDDLEIIYNYDLPKENTQYVHRIGRTARAGKKGKAIALIYEAEERSYLKMCKDFKFSVKKESVTDLKIFNLNRNRNISKGPVSKRDGFFLKQVDFLKKKDGHLDNRKDNKKNFKRQKDNLKHKNKLKQKKYIRKN